ncbi:MAG: hypothetical protein LBG48_04650, partial [Rickettsiales bacterium]|nr:hypothetical protein [Rickettsiales bacterium]
MKKFILSLLVAFFWLTGLASAQNIEPWPKEGIGLEIYNSNITWANHGQFAYEFTVDAQQLFTIDVSDISNLAIETNYGTIECSDGVNSSDAGRYTTCLLLSETSDEPLIITNVVGVIDGKKYDLTSNVDIGDFKPLTLVNMMTHSINTVNCPRITVPIHPLVGTIVTFECEHSCSLTVKLDD